MDNLCIEKLDETTTLGPQTTLQNEKKTPWKLYMLTLATILSLILFNFCPPIKNALYSVGVSLHSLGWLGPLLIILLSGLIVIPLALPYTIFEMTIAFLMKNYLHALLVSMAGKFLGAFVSFLLTKTLMKKSIQVYLQNFQKFREIEVMLEKQPWKFSLMLRVSILPLFLKNYGLAIPNSIGVTIYMTVVLITTAPTTALNLYLLRQAGSLENIFNGNRSILQIAFSVMMVALSICLFVYISKYTNKVCKQLDKIKLSEIQITADLEAGDESPTAEKLTSIAPKDFKGTIELFKTMTPERKMKEEAKEEVADEIKDGDFIVTL